MVSSKSQLASFLAGVTHDGRQLSYENTVFHRIVPGFVAQGGDVLENTGRGNADHKGELFPDESFKYSHDKRGTAQLG